jgi:hypothetical protein
MKAPIVRQVFAAAIALGLSFAVLCGTAGATGTARIMQRDGSATTYTNVRIAVRDQSMWMTASDGRGTLVFGKAACTMIDDLLECLPYDATLYQNGERRHIPLRSGTAWFNPSQTYRHLTHSSAQLPPRGVLLSVVTKDGTYLTLTGVVDEMQK